MKTKNQFKATTALWLQGFAGLILALAFSQAPSFAATNDLSSLLQKGLFEEEANHDFGAAIQAYQSVVERFDENRKLAATAAFRLAECYRKQNKTNEAVVQYQRVLRDFAEQDPLPQLSRQALTSLSAGSTISSALPIGSSGQISSNQLAELRRLPKPRLRIVLQQLSPDPVLTRLMQELTSATQDLSEKLKSYGDTHPKIVGLRERIAIINTQIDEQVDGLIAALELRSITASPETARHDSTEQQELARLENILQASPDLINAYESGLTPLHRAARAGQLTVMKFLLEHGVDIETPSRESGSGESTALHIAVLSGRKSMVELLLGYKARLGARDGRGATPLHLSASKGFKSVTEALLAAKADVTARDNEGKTPLHYAANAGQKAIVELLIERGTEVNAKDSSGRTPLVDAIEGNRADVLKTLLARGAEVNFYFALAASTPMQENIFLGNRTTPLHLAIYNNNSDITGLLLDQGANPNAFSGNADGATPLSIAIVPDNTRGFSPERQEFDHAWFVSNLLKHKADPNLNTNNYDAPLIQAISRGDLKSVNLLLEAGASANVKQRSDGGTPLHMAANMGNLPILGTLLAHHADISAVDERKDTALHLAASRSLKEPVAMLLEAGADPNVLDRNGVTPLVYAKGANRPDRDAVVALLLAHGAREDLPKFDAIQLRRAASGVSKIIFSRGTNENRFTLFELLGVHYRFLADTPEGSNPRERDRSELLALNQFNTAGALPFPDLEHVRLRRPVASSKQWQEQVFDLNQRLLTGTCKDVSLEWGDVIELPETDHPLNEKWSGFNRAQLDAFKECLSREVTISVKGKETKITLAPQIDAAGYITTQYPIWLKPVLRSSNLLLSSSDLSRVTVSRRNQQRGPQEFTVDCAKSAPDFWLREGDVIRVPDRAE